MEVVVREEVGCPAQARKNSESLRGVPGVLRIHPGDGAAVGLLLLRALVEYVLGAEEEVEERLADGVAAIGVGAGVVAGGGKVAVRVVAATEVQLVANELAANDEVVWPRTA